MSTHPTIAALKARLESDGRGLINTTPQEIAKLKEELERMKK